jgi:lysophospholipase L1-like esterase
MMDSVPWTEFLEGQNVHLSADGHALFGRALAGRVRPLIEGVP